MAAVGVGIVSWRDWAKREKEEREKTHAQQCSDCQWEGLGGGGEGYQGYKCDGWRLDLQWWTHYAVYIRCVELSPENCILLLTSVTPKNSIEREKTFSINSDFYGNVTIFKYKYLVHCLNTQVTSRNVYVLNSSSRFTILLAPGLNRISFYIWALGF